MYYKTYKPSFVLSRRSGWKTTFPDILSLRAAVVGAGMTLSADVLDGEWCAFDHDGDLVHPDAVAIGTRRPSVIWLGSLNIVQRAAALGLPIPYTGGRHRGRTNYYRRNRHIAVKRALAAIETEIREDRLRVKGIRPGDHAPDPWDDRRASDWGHRTWKRSRRNKWRKVATSWKSLDGSAPGASGRVFEPSEFSENHIERILHLIDSDIADNPGCLRTMMEYDVARIQKLVENVDVDILSRLPDEEDV